MKFRITMKDPDTLHDAIDDAVTEDLDATVAPERERDVIRTLRCKDAADIAAQWFKWSEYLTVEIDTETKTIRVCDASE